MIIVSPKRSCRVGTGGSHFWGLAAAAPGRCRAWPLTPLRPRSCPRPAGLLRPLPCAEGLLRPPGRRAARCAAGSAALLELPSEWAASFLTPIYSDHVSQSLEESTRLLMKAGEIVEEQ